jgi:PAS domain S-box-containing protein
MKLQNNPSLPNRLDAVDGKQSDKPADKLNRTFEHVRKDTQGRDLLRVVHDLKLHEVELEEQNTRLRDNQIRLEKAAHDFSVLYEYAPVGYCTVDLFGTIRQINHTARMFFGLGRNTLIGSEIQNLLDFGPFFELHQYLQDCYNGAQQQPLEARCISSPSKVKAIEIASIRKPTSSSRDKEVLLAFVDKTFERHSRENELFLLHASGILAHSVGTGNTIQHALQLAQQMSGALVVLDIWREGSRAYRYVGDGRLIYGQDRYSVAAGFFANSTQTQIESYVNHFRGVRNPSVVKGANVAVLFNDRELVTALCDESIREVLVMPLYAQEHLTGVMTFMLGQENAHLGNQDHADWIRYARLAAAYIDNAHLLKLAQEAAASRDHLLAIVSHDLRNPLSAVRLRSERLLHGRRASKDTNVIESARHIVKYAERMDHLIGDLLDVSIIESGSLSMRWERVNLKELFRDILDVWRPVFDEAGIFTMANEVANVCVRADQARLQQAVGNLLGNALKFTPEGGRVSLSVQENGTYAHFSITDTGVGIDPAKMSRVFDKFWQEKDGDKKGIGLGMSITKGIVECSGGKIWLDSVLGQGTTVHFTIPIWREGRRSGSNSQSGVLVVDDNLDRAFESYWKMRADPFP